MQCINENEIEEEIHVCGGCPVCGEYDKELIREQAEYDEHEHYEY